MSIVRRASVLAVGLVLFGAPLLTTWVQAQGATTRDDTITIAIQSDPRSLNGFVKETSPIYEMANNVFDKLLWFDNHGKLVGDLAQSWEQSADSRVVTLHLRPNVLWHDGVKFTSADVKWHMETAKGTNSNFGSYMKHLESVETPDGLTVVARFDAPFPIQNLALYSASADILPKHLYEGKSLTDNPSNTMPVGTGPYKVVDYKQDEYMIMEANPVYFGGAPRTKRLVFRFIPSPSSAIAELRAGSVDAAWDKYNYPVAELSQLVKDPQIRSTALAGSIVIRLLFNNRPEAIAKSPWLKDLHVRQAFAMAIDRDQIVDGALFGLVKKSWGPYAAGMPAYKADLQAPKYDPAQAERLLDEAGYRRGPDGVRIRAEMPYIPYFGTEQVAQSIQQMLKKVGVEVTLSTDEYNAFFTKYWGGPQGQGETPLTVSIGPTGPDPQDIALMYHSKNQPRLNSVNVNVPEVDRLFDQAAGPGDFASKLPLYQKIQEQLSDALPAVWIGSVTNYWLYSPRVQGFDQAGAFSSHERLDKLSIVGAVPAAASAGPSGNAALIAGGVVVALVLAGGVGLATQRRKRR